MPKTSWEAKSYLLRFFFSVINEINSSQIFCATASSSLTTSWFFWIITTTDFCAGSCGKVGDGKTAEEKMEAEMRPLRTAELDKHSERGFVPFQDDPKKPNMCCVGQDNSHVDRVYLGRLQLVLSSKHLMDCHRCNYRLCLCSLCKNSFQRSTGITLKKMHYINSCIPFRQSLWTTFQSKIKIINFQHHFVLRSFCSTTLVLEPQPVLAIKFKCPQSTSSCFLLSMFLLSYIKRILRIMWLYRVYRTYFFWTSLSDIHCVIEYSPNLYIKPFLTI